MTNTSAALNPAIADLWRDLRAWLADALAVSRGPAAVARVLAHAAHAAIKRRLQLIESMLVKLLLIEAEHFRSHPFPDARVARSPGPINASTAGKPAPRVAAAMDSGAGAVRQFWNGCENPNSPETWRVRFRPRLHHLLRRDMRTRGACVTSTHAPEQCAGACAETVAAQKARALSRRFEALRRVIADPRRAIAALARRLGALGKAAHVLARAIALSRPPRCVGAPMSFAHAMVRACDASAAFHNTS
jgi:hypothetical protein